MKAQSDARPALCWTLVSTGARLCQSLGYHRESSVSLDSPPLADAKRHVFWMLYMIDKIMSLNLGRASSFPDYDIDVEIFALNQDLRFCAWIKCSWLLLSFVGCRARYMMSSTRRERDVSCRRLERGSSNSGLRAFLLGMWA